MARTFVFSDNMSARVEVESTDSGETFYAFCVGCGIDLVQDMHERFTRADTMDAAETHADQCQRCSDSQCQTVGRHDAGHRCRKP